MRKLFLLALSILSISFLFAQKDKSENAIASKSFFAEGGGPGIAFSANFDTRFNRSSHIGLGGRIGLGFVSAYEYDTSYYYYDKQTSAITIPVQVNYVFGKTSSPHSFEVGAGVTYVTKKLEIMDFYDDNRTQFFGTFCFMYRRQPVNGGFSWRAGFTPLIGKNLIQPFGAVSVGYNF